MTFSPVSAFLAMFSKPPAMDIDGFSRLCQPTAKYSVEDFLHILLCEAVQAKLDPSTVLDRFVVDQVSHDKNVVHELLVIDTSDTQVTGKKNQFIFDRNMSRDIVPESKKSTDPPKLEVDIDTTTQTIYTPKLFEKVKPFVDSLLAVLKPGDHLSAMEEGTFSRSASVASSLSTTGSFTASVSEVADATSEALDDSLDRNKNLAVDRILGSHFIKPQSIRCRYFKPEGRLTLFQFVLLTYVVHKLYPYYTSLGKQCLFMAGLVYEAAELFCRESSTNVDAAPLGCWKNVKITKSDPKLVSEVVTQFKRALAKQRAIVSLCSFELFSLSNTLYIDRGAGSV
jgi:hypothetical protein